MRHEWPCIVHITGTRKPMHAQQTAQAAQVRLTAADVRLIRALTIKKPEQHDLHLALP